VTVEPKSTQRPRSSCTRRADSRTESRTPVGREEVDSVFTSWCLVFKQSKLMDNVFFLMLNCFVTAVYNQHDITKTMHHRIVLLFLFCLFCGLQRNCVVHPCVDNTLSLNP